MKGRGHGMSRGKVSGVKISLRTKVESLTNQILENLDQLDKKTFLLQSLE